MGQFEFEAGYRCLIVSYDSSVRRLTLSLIAGVVSACHVGSRSVPDAGDQEKSAEFRGIALIPLPSAAPVLREPPAPPGVASGNDGYLNINSIPPSMCFLDEQALGRTPRIHVPVKPGTHVVRFVSAEDGLTKSISVTVDAGETRPAVAKL